MATDLITKTVKNSEYYKAVKECVMRIAENGKCRAFVCDRDETWDLWCELGQPKDFLEDKDKAGEEWAEFNAWKRKPWDDCDHYELAKYLLKCNNNSVSALGDFLVDYVKVETGYDVLSYLNKLICRLLNEELREKGIELQFIENGQTLCIVVWLESDNDTMVVGSENAVPLDYPNNWLRYTLMGM